MPLHEVNEKEAQDKAMELAKEFTPKCCYFGSSSCRFDIEKQETLCARLLAAEVELASIDETLARRPALADESTRRAKIETAINTAKRVDQLRAELEYLKKETCACRWDNTGGQTIECKSHAKLRARNALIEKALNLIDESVSKYPGLPLCELKAQGYLSALDQAEKANNK